jgi:hypothetical protein
MAQTMFQLTAGLATPRTLCELIEVMHAQSLPDPVDTDSDVQSLAALYPERFTGDDRPLQDTVLKAPARVVMPWGSVALQDHHERAGSFGAVTADVVTVELVVPR